MILPKIVYVVLKSLRFQACSIEASILGGPFAFVRDYVFYSEKGVVWKQEFLTHTPETLASGFAGAKLPSMMSIQHPCDK